jgi:hypothetical protein
VTVLQAAYSRIHPPSDDVGGNISRDRSLSALFEHSVGVTADGVEIFTLSQRNGEKPLATS